MLRNGGIPAFLTSLLHMVNEILRYAQPIFLTPPGNSGEVKHPVQMRFGMEFDWEGQPSTVLMFYFREDISLQDSQTVHLSR